MIILFTNPSPRGHSQEGDCSSRHQAGEHPSRRRVQSQTMRLWIRGQVPRQLGEKN